MTIIFYFICKNKKINKPNISSIAYVYQWPKICCIEKISVKSTFSVGAVNEEMIEKALSTRMKNGYKSWLTFQNTLLVNWIIIGKIGSMENQISQ